VIQLIQQLFAAKSVDVRLCRRFNPITDPGACYLHKQVRFAKTPVIPDQPILLIFSVNGGNFDYFAAVEYGNLITDLHRFAPSISAVVDKFGDLLPLDIVHLSKFGIRMAFPCFQQGKKAIKKFFHNITSLIFVFPAVYYARRRGL
jgi:hypothetical protein